MKKTFKKFTPNPSVVREHKYLKKLKLDNPSLWNFNRKSISKGVAVGLFCAFLPMPMQMIVASIFAVIFSGNILISIALVWITNPLTIPPIYYALYKFGAWILSVPPIQGFNFSIDFFTNAFSTIWQPLLLGSLLISVITSILGYHIVNGIYIFKIKTRTNAKKSN